jgi:prevent-host-death family protein
MRNTRARKATVREAKAHLSKLIRDARRGQEWLITARGKAVAKIVPVPQGEIPLDERIRRLEDAGLVEPLGSPVRELPPPLPLKEGLAQRWLQEHRGS